MSEYFYFAIMFAVITPIIAHSRGRSVVGWLLLGLIFNVFALILVALLPSRADPLAGTTASSRRALGYDNPNDDAEQVRCPECRELVRHDARKCKHCGSALTPSN